MRFPRGQAHTCMERTNQPTTQSRKGQTNILTEKTHRVITITQGRKDQAQPDGLPGWDRVPRKAPAPLEHQQDQEGIKYGPLLDHQASRDSRQGTVA